MLLELYSRDVMYAIFGALARGDVIIVDDTAGPPVSSNRRTLRTLQIHLTLAISFVSFELHIVVLCSHIPWLHTIPAMSAVLRSIDLC
eukprot:9503830-Pyramimonas_sp.AAC.8